jgi:asparagine synthase (glutamine-hydrolysing)
LLSGGLDSSLIVAIAYKILGVTDLRVFSIGLESKDSSDLLYAQKVADHLGLPSHQYTQFLIDPHTAIESVPSVIDACETYDITTIRASVMQYHLARLISETTDIRILLNGDGADELAMGYLYFHYAPGTVCGDNEDDFDIVKKENLKLLREIHYFDGLRVDRNLGHFGMEARVPFLDQDFVDFYLSIPYSLKIPGKGRRFPQEKALLRQAFHHVYPDLLPQEVLFRKKEAFSDGVSSTQDSWYQTLSSHYSKLSKKTKNVADNKMTNVPNQTDEASFYLETFQQRFKGYEHIIPHYWMPAFVDRETVQDPSARTLGVYLEYSG